jgi:hypothetical protein
MLSRVEPQPARLEKVLIQGFGCSPVVIALVMEDDL